MPKKRPIKKHSVKANQQVVELTRAGSSLDLEIYADQEKDWDDDYWARVAFVEGWEAAD